MGEQNNLYDEFVTNPINSNKQTIRTRLIFTSSIIVVNSGAISTICKVEQMQLKVGK